MPQNGVAPLRCLLGVKTAIEKSARQVLLAVTADILGPFELLRLGASSLVLREARCKELVYKKAGMFRGKSLQLARYAIKMVRHFAFCLIRLMRSNRAKNRFVLAEGSLGPAGLGQERAANAFEMSAERVEDFADAPRSEPSVIWRWNRVSSRESPGGRRWRARPADRRGSGRAPRRRRRMSADKPRQPLFPAHAASASIA